MILAAAEAGTGDGRSVEVTTNLICDLDQFEQTVAAEIADIDPLQPRSRGGPTNAANGKVMCDKHNIHKHATNYTIQRQPNGTIHITRPNGTLLQPPDAA